MIDGQQKIVTAEDQVLPGGPCAWCGTPTTKKLVVEKARHTTNNVHGIRVVKRRAIEPWCCEAHLASLKLRDDDEGPGPGVVVSPDARAQSMIDEDEDVFGCPGYPEHDYRLRDEADGWRVWDCQRCGAELFDEVDDDS